MVDFIVSLANASWHLLLEMSPYLLLGFILAGILYAFLPPSWISRYMGGESLGSVIRASLVGIPLPLCSCGVLPVAASARESGAGRAPTLAFLISTPVTGIDSIIATAGVLGIVFTFARIIVSFILSIIAGAISILFPDREEKKSSAECLCESCELSPAKAGVIHKTQRAFRYSFFELPGSLFNSLVVGILVGGLISALIPENLIANYLGGRIWGIFVAILLGIPLYVCATGSIPIASAMMLKGFSPGAGLAFLIAGPATNAVALTTVRKILGTKALIIYLITIFTGAIGFAFLFDLLPLVFNFKNALIPHSMSHHSWFYHLSAGVLILSLGFAKSKQWLHSFKFKKAEKMAQEKNLILIKVPDMTCSHCQQLITKNLSQISSITSVEVDLKNKKLALTGKELNPEKILEIIKSLGYHPELVK